MRRNVQIVVYVPVNARRLAINYKDHRIDYSRCVTCMDCIVPVSMVRSVINIGLGKKR